MKRLSKKNEARLLAGKLPEPSEDDVQKQIVDWLHAHGYLVQITTRRVKKCRKCGTFPSQGDGATKGIADLLVRANDWPNGIWLALEVKRPGGFEWSSKEQETMYFVGGFYVVQSIEDTALSITRFAHEIGR